MPETETEIRQQLWKGGMPDELITADAFVYQSINQERKRYSYECEKI